MIAAMIVVAFALAWAGLLWFAGTDDMRSIVGWRKWFKVAWLKARAALAKAGV